MSHPSIPFIGVDRSELRQYIEVTEGIVKLTEPDKLSRFTSKDTPSCMRSIASSFMGETITEETLSQVRDLWRSKLLESLSASICIRRNIPFYLHGFDLPGHGRLIFSHLPEIYIATQLSDFLFGVANSRRTTKDLFRSIPEMDFSQVQEANNPVWNMCIIRLYMEKPDLYHVTFPANEREYISKLCDPTIWCGLRAGTLVFTDTGEIESANKDEEEDKSSSVFVGTDPAQFSSLRSTSEKVTISVTVYAEAGSDRVKKIKDFISSQLVIPGECFEINASTTETVV